MPCLSGALPCASDARGSFYSRGGKHCESIASPPLAVVDYNLQWVE